MKGFKTTEKTVRLIEGENTIVVIFNRDYTKDRIKKEVEQKLKVKVDKVRTTIQDNKKIAYIKLNEKNPAIDIATKFGLI